jgi:hypothetical protein
MEAQEKGYLLTISPKPEIKLLTLTRDEFGAIDDQTLPGLRLRLDRRQRTSQLQIEIADRQQASYQLPEFSQASMDDFLCRLFGRISQSLLATARGRIFAKKQTTPEQPTILPMKRKEA